MQRDKQWDSIATLHEGMYLATTWSYNKICMGEHKLKPPEFEKGVVATCLTVTHCGNFVIVGKELLCLHSHEGIQIYLYNSWH